VTGLTSGSKYIRLWLSGYNRPNSYGDPSRVEAGDVTVTIDSSNVPSTQIIAGAGDTYLLNPTITNETTEESVTLDTAVELNDSVEMDSAARTVTKLADNTRINSSLTTNEGVRARYLKAQPGNNTLRYDETGAQGVTVDWELRKRYRV